MPESFTFEEANQPQSFTFEEATSEPVKTSAIGALTRSAMTGALPALGFRIGSSITAPISASPAGPWVGVPAGLAAGVASAMGVDALQRKALEFISPEFAAQLRTEQAADVAQHPWASAAGRLIGGLGGFRLAPGKVFTLPPAQAAAQIGAGTALGIGLPLATAAVKGEPLRAPTVPEIVESAAFPVLFGAGRFSRPESASFGRGDAGPPITAEVARDIPFPPEAPLPIALLQQGTLPGRPMPAPGRGAPQTIPEIERFLAEQRIQEAQEVPSPEKRATGEPIPIIGDEQPAAESNIILPERFMQNESRREAALQRIGELQDEFSIAAREGNGERMTALQNELLARNKEVQDLQVERSRFAKEFEGEYPPTAAQLGTFESRASVPELSGVTRRAEPERLPVAEQPSRATLARQAEALPETEYPERIGVVPPETLRGEFPTGRAPVLGKEPPEPRGTIILESHPKPSEPGIVGVERGAVRRDVPPVEPTGTPLVSAQEAALARAAVSGGERGIIRGTPLESWADRVISEGKKRLFTGLDPELLSAYAVKGAALLEQGVRDFAAWSARMIREVGRNLSADELQRLFRRSQFYYERKQRSSGAREPAPVEQAPPPSEAPKAIGEVMKSGAGEAAPVTPVTESVTEQRVAQVGIVPPGFGATSAIGRHLSRAWEGIKTAWKTSPNKEQMAASMDAAENAARIGGDQMGRRVELMAPNPLDRQAITFIIEANGDPSQLGIMLSKTVGKNLDATKAIQHAIANWDRLAPVAQKTSNIMDDQLAFERASGVDTDNVEGYIKHAYDMDLLMGKGQPVILTGSGGGVSSAFKKQRAFPTYADAIAAGYTPKTLDSAALVASRVAAGTKLVNRIKWGDALRGVNDPSSGQPIVTGVVTQPKGTQVAPPGYTMNEVIPGMRVAVHKGYEKMFDAITGGSAVGEFELAGLPVGEIVLKTEGAIKHGLLAFDTFHASRIAQKQLFLTGRVGYAKGKTLLDYSDADLAEAVKQDLITKEMADYAKANRPDAELLIKSGLNVGQVQEALYAATVRKLPVIGSFNKWVFDKLTRGAMMEAGITEINRLANKNPEVPREQIARAVARDLNQYFGNLGRQGVFKSKTYQDWARIVALAPNWVESMARTELGAARQLGKVPVDLAQGRTAQIGTLAKGVGNGLLAYFVGTQLLNLATRKHFTWDNPEKDHKLDAWIPDVTGKTPGFFISPFSVAAELTHDFIRYSARKSDAVEVLSTIAGNKLSPFARAASVLFNGEDYSGTKIYGSWNKIKAAAWSLAPTPIPLSGQIKGQSYPGQTQRQLLGSAGLKVELAPKREVPRIVEKLNITSRAGLEEYLNSVARASKELPIKERMAYVQTRFREDGLAPRYHRESIGKMRFKVRD